jgi:molybdopterin/thiamine biosynthesis adenylyltransferase
MVSSAIANGDRGKHVIQVGLGNIGSFGVPHIARIPNVARVTLIDPDVYEEKNLRSQDIAASDVGKPKVRVQKQRLHRIAPHLQVDALRARIEDVPLGLLRGDTIVTGLDSKLARQFVNERAWIIGVPWIDAGVSGDGLLARVTTYTPGDKQPCIECNWGQAQYDLLEQEYACDHDDPAAGVAAGSPSYLGALAASLAINEARTILTGRHADIGGRQVLVDIDRHHHYVTTASHNSLCRMPFHDRGPLPEPATVARNAQLGSLLSRAAGPQHDVSLAIAGRSFANAVTCDQCGHRKEQLKLCTPSLCKRRCSSCGGNTSIPGFDLIEQLALEVLGRRSFDRSLRGLGARAGDIILITDEAGNERCLEVRT